MKFTKGKWSYSKIANEIIEGAESSKIYGDGKNKVIGRINATHNEEGFANLKLIVNAKPIFKVLTELITELELQNYDLPKHNDRITDRIYEAKNVIKNILK